MTREEIQALMGMEGDDCLHRIGHFIQARYTRDEIETFNRWWGRLGHHGMLLTRGEIIQAYTTHLPARSESCLVAIISALWDDGYQGPLPARILNRPPCD